ncbi:ParB/RepB/Spo0J family partition protein [Scytonema tolypothrichoides VB-61278]|nr:ParB/RepB/Spo0J family partition protein [Scytonema tolypothrichoides VB-61278]
MAANKKPDVFKFGVPDVLDVLAGQGVDSADSITALPLTKIVLPKSQPRRYFDPQKLAQLTHSIKVHGILEPLLVRPLENERYELIAGERRYRAAKEAGLDEVPVVIRDLDDRKAYQLALVENLQREDLNPVEETEGLLELLSLELALPRKDVVSIIDQALNAKKRSLELTENVFSQFNKIESILAATSNISTESFRTARLPLLNVPEEILEALREGRLEYTKARAIATLKEAKPRKALLKEAIEKNLSLSQIKEKIAAYKAAQAKGQGEKTDKSLAYPARLKALYAKAKKVKTWDDARKQEEFEELLQRMEKLL